VNSWRGVRRLGIGADGAEGREGEVSLEGGDEDGAGGPISVSAGSNGGAGGSGSANGTGRDICTAESRGGALRRE